MNATVKFYLLSSIFCLVLNSCGQARKIYYGAKKPIPESSNEILEWQVKHNLVGYESFCLKPESYCEFLPELFGVVKLFNKFGNFVPLKMSQYDKECGREDGVIATLRLVSWEKEFTLRQRYLERFKEDSLAYQNGSQSGKPFNELDYTINDILSSSIGLQTSKNLYEGLDTFDYILVISWAKFMGHKGQLKYLEDIKSAITQNKHSRFRIIYLNFDLNKNWTESQIKQIERACFNGF